MSPESEIQGYETLVVLQPELGEAGVAELTEQVKRIIESTGGSSTQVDQWGMRELAYPIRKQSRGFYQIFYYNGTGATVKELERSLKLNDQVLRVVSVRQTAEGGRLQLRNPLVTENPTVTDSESSDSTQSGESNGSEGERQRP